MSNNSDLNFLAGLSLPLMPCEDNWAVIIGWDIREQSCSIGNFRFGVRDFSWTTLTVFEISDIIWPSEVHVLSPPNLEIIWATELVFDTFLFETGLEYVYPATRTMLVKSALLNEVFSLLTRTFLPHLLFEILSHWRHIEPHPIKTGTQRQDNERTTKWQCGEIHKETKRGQKLETKTKQKLWPCLSIVSSKTTGFKDKRNLSSHSSNCVTKFDSNYNSLSTVWHSLKSITVICVAGQNQ